MENLRAENLPVMDPTQAAGPLESYLQLSPVGIAQQHMCTHTSEIADPTNQPASSFMFQVSNLSICSNSQEKSKALVYVITAFLLSSSRSAYQVSNQTIFSSAPVGVNISKLLQTCLLVFQD